MPAQNHFGMSKNRAGPWSLIDRGPA